MKELPAIPRLRRYLAAGYALLIVYASLSPFSGWQEQGLEFAAILRAPLLQTYTPFDAVANLLAYLPFGLLLGLTLRARLSASNNVLLTTAIATLLSAVLEFAQMYLPSRISSNADLLINSVGALLGVALAISIAPHWLALLKRWRQRLFHPEELMDFGLALVAVWIFAQVNPSVPMLGNVFISEAAPQPFAATPHEPFNWLASLAVALNLLMLGCLLFTLLHTRRHAVSLLALLLGIVALAKFVAAALLLKSWALLLWLNGEAILGICLGLLSLLALGKLQRAPLLWVAALIAAIYLALVQWILDSGTPTAAKPLYQWHSGHLSNYNGLVKIISSLFPLCLLFYLWRLRRHAPSAV